MTIAPRDLTVTKTDLVRQALRSGREIEALRIAKGFRMLGDEKRTIQRGWDAYANPRFAQSLGRDPDLLVREAILALRRLYPD